MPWRGPGGCAGSPDARQFAHEEAQIRATDVDEQTLEHVGVSAQMHAAQSPGFVKVGVGTLEAFPTLPQQAPAAEQPRMRRRLAWTAARAAGLPRQRRRPRSGSDTSLRIPNSANATRVSLL